MNERIKFLRKHLNMNQEDMGNKIGVTKATISRIEKGVNKITEQMIKSICREFNVNENWLRNGTGEMFAKTSNELIEQIVEKYNFSDTEKQALEAYLQLSNDDRAKISDLIKSIFGGFFKINNIITATKKETSDNDINKEVEAYRQELEAEKKGKISSVSEKPKGA